MKMGRTFRSLFRECDQYNIPLMQCPQFLFVIMGTLIVATMISIYALGTQFFSDPYLIVMVVCGITAILFIMSFVITRSFERLAEANRLKSEFVSIVSHQLRAPLSNLGWAIDFVMSGRAGRVQKEQTAYFQILKENSSRMQELVNDLLSVSRIEQGTFPFEKKPFSMTELVNDVVEEYRSLVRAANIDLKVNTQGKGMVNSDPQKIRQVISNLLDNAIKYAWKDDEENRHNRRVKMSVIERKKDVRFEIEDSGVGIPERDQKHIFQKFFRSGSVQQHDTQGSGLGLYIAKSIIEKADGRIGFESEESKGSKFWFVLPVKNK